MKLQTKMVLISGLSFAIFLALTSLLYFRFPLTLYIPIALALFAMTTILFYRAALVQLEKPKRTIKKLEQDLQSAKKELITLEIEKEKLLSENNKLQVRLVENKITQPIIPKQSKSIVQLAHYDELTALPNRIFFHQILHKTISHVKRRKQILALLALDIKNFKETNTEFGRDVGDLVLKELVERIGHALRHEDMLARFNGDEFIVLLNDIGKPKFASAVAQKILAAAAEPFQINNNTVNLSLSIGIAIYPEDGKTLEELISHVDKALFQAKQEGVSTYKFYNHSMDVEGHEFVKIELGLRHALQNNELILYYQPKMHIKQGNINGVEALLRWMHPELGLITPQKFLPVAEDTGLSMLMAKWAITEACKETKFWQMEGYEHLTTSINLSTKQFNDENIAAIILNALEESGLNAKYLELEVNEDTVMSDIERSLVQFNLLKETGVKLSIDHFGTGYTSISHLKKFPINTIKIDRSFIKGVPQNPNDVAITNAFIGLAHNLGLEVVAEGVETAEQMQYLSTQQCDIVQGYFLSHPMPANKIIKQFKKLRDEVLL